MEVFHLDKLPSKFLAIPIDCDLINFFILK